MNVSDFQSIARDKLNKLESLLEQLHGIKLDWTCTDAELQEILEHYDSKRSATLTEGQAYDAGGADYSKFVLITEAIRIYLKEIAPKRRKQRRTK